MKISKMSGLSEKLHRLSSYIILLASVMLLSGCKPDKIEVEIYTSDIQSASSKGVVEVPASVIFSVIGDDDDGLLPRASAVAKQYLGEKAEFKMSKSDWGDMMVVKCSIPMGTMEALNAYLETQLSPLALTIGQSTVKLEVTQHIESLNEDLSDINMLIDFDMPAKNTIFRLIGDMGGAPEISAVAVFIDEKPELIYRTSIGRRTSVDIDYNGGDGSVYSEVSPQFNFKF